VDFEWCRRLADWLNFKVGLNLGAARERVRVAHALPSVPKIAAAMSRGELSYSKVRALTRVATPASNDISAETSVNLGRRAPVPDRR
jgi:hypothetical protein